MFKYVLSLTFAVGLASAATISTSATCDGVTTVGTFFASCNDGRYMAYASLSAPSFVDTRIGPFPDFSVSNDVNQVAGPPGSGSATANFSDDYVFTINGGTGAGFFCPVIEVGHGSGASAGMSFAGIGSVTEECFISGGVPFTFGVPQVIGIGMGAQTSGVGELSGGAEASLQSISFFDAAGNPLPNINFTLVEVPEPSAWSLLGVGMLFFLAVAIRGMR